MNLIDESFETKKTDNSKKIATIILVIIAILIVFIIGTFIAIIYMQDSELKLYINGKSSDAVKEMMVIESDGTIYFPIKDIASYLDYESYNGEYANRSEEANKCYIQCDDEIVNFVLNSNKIYKLTTSSNDNNYEYYYAAKPVKAINGKLYATTDALEYAYNVSFLYDTSSNRVYFYTLPYLINSYTSNVLDYGYEGISEEFINKKSIFDNMLVVTKDGSKTYAVIDVEGNVIIEPKYDYIEFLPYSGDFLVTSNGKVGIISSQRETKVQLLYDSLELIDNDAGIYLAKRDDKYGVIDARGNIKIYIEYDQIGIDNTRFKENDIKNKYLLDNGMIPVRKDSKWGTFNKDGDEILAFEYDSFGYTASSTRDAINLLLIPNYNLLVVCQNKKYGLVNSDGETVVRTMIDDVYMTISSGKTYYYMNVNNQTVNIEEWLDSVGVKPSSNQTTNTTNSTNENVTEDE